MMRIGVVGAGSHSQSNHGPSLQHWVREHPGKGQLAAVCDLTGPRAEAYAQKFGFQAVYTDLEVMLRQEELHALVAITAIETTCDLGLRLLKAGIPLLLEKPPGRNTEETRRLLSTAEEHDARCMISFNRRFSPALTRAAEWVRAQGPLESVEARMLRHNRREPGFMTDTGIHLVDATASLLENPRIDAVRHAPGASGVQALMSDAAGRTASVTILPVCGCVAEEYSICGEAFRAEVDVGACTFRGWRAGELAAEWRAPDEWPKWMLAGAYAETEAFLQMAEGVGPCQPDLHAGLASMQLVERLAQ